VSDIGLARTVLIVGSNPLDTLPPIAQWFERQRATGGRQIVVDPRRTPTARIADLHLQLTPGSDLALANGLLFIAIEERLLDESFIRDRTTGFDAARRSVLHYHPARVEQLTGVPESQLRLAARWLAAGPSMIFTGRGPEQQSKGVDTVLAFINLALALGQVGKVGGGYGCLTGQGNGQGGREHGQKADQLPGYRLIEIDAHREHIARVWGVEPATLPRKGRSAYELLDSCGRQHGIRGLLVMGSNIAVASPDVGSIIQRLKSLDFLVVCDAFATETAELADVVLPVTQWAEEDGTMTNLEGRVIRRRRALSPPPGVRSDIEILHGLAARLGCGEKFEFPSPESVFDELRRASAGGVADYAGITYEGIDRDGGVYWPCPAVGHPGTPRLFTERFHHANGRARFHAVGHRPAGEEPDVRFPLYLTTGRYHEQYNSGAQTRRIPRLAAAKPRLQMHPDVAANHGIGNGWLVTVESRRGRAEFVAEVTSEVRSDTLFAPFHWGGRDAANLLTNAALDPVSRMPEFKLAAVRVVAVRKEPNAPILFRAGEGGEGGEPLSCSPHFAREEPGERSLP